MCMVPHAETHLPPPIPPFLLVQNLFSKCIAPTDNMAEVAWWVHSSSVVKIPKKVVELSGTLVNAWGGYFCYWNCSMMQKGIKLMQLCWVKTTQLFLSSTLLLQVNKMSSTDHVSKQPVAKTTHTMCHKQHTGVLNLHPVMCYIALAV